MNSNDRNSNQWKDLFNIFDAFFPKCRTWSWFLNLWWDRALSQPLQHPTLLEVLWVLCWVFWLTASMQPRSGEAYSPPPLLVACPRSGRSSAAAFQPTPEPRGWSEPPRPPPRERCAGSPRQTPGPSRCSSQLPVLPLDPQRLEKHGKNHPKLWPFLTWKTILKPPFQKMGVRIKLWDRIPRNLLKTSYSQGRIRKCVQIRSQLLHMKQHPLVCRLSHFVHAKSSCLRIKIYLCKMQGCMLMFCTQNPDSSGVLHVESQFLKFKSLFFACVCKPNSGFQIDSIHMCKPNHQSCMCNICIYIYIYYMSNALFEG